MALLHSGFLRSSALMPGRPALEVGGTTLTYGALGDRAAAIGATLARRTPPGGSPLAAVFAHRSATAYAGILGTLFAGRGYVPLNPTFPAARTRWMLQNADCRALVVDSKCAAQLDVVLEGIAAPMLIILPEQQDVSALAGRWPSHTVVGARTLERPESCRFAAPLPDAVAYLLFTSGSTGVPKGVTVAHANATHFVDAMVARYGITEHDRFSQMFDHTFDLSVFDMFVAWRQGACVCCPSERVLMNPDAFIRDAKLTIWFSVPSVGVLMKRFGVLRDDRYTSLRWSLFCGEPLPSDVAGAWATAAPRSVVENLYGPTELTVACTMYRWDARRSPSESRLGIVPIGQAAPGMQVMVVDDQLREVPPGVAGELIVTGPQLTRGYWRNPDATARAYVRPPGKDAIYYRTGDRVFRPLGDGPLTYLGRVDHQIKVAGYRVELGEVEATLREEPGVEAAVALGWPMTATGAAGIVAFVTGRDVDPGVIRSRVKARLQGYAVPNAIRVLPDLPLTSNGKVDRQALVGLLDAAAATRRTPERWVGER